MSPASGSPPVHTASSATAEEPVSALSLDDAGESYVRLVLAVGLHDPDYVDAFHGPPEWQQEAEAQAWSVAEIRRRAETWSDTLASLEDSLDDPELLLRHRFLATHVRALDARCRILEGEKMAFDDACQALYGTVAPRQEGAKFREVLERLARRLDDAGVADGPVQQRVETYLDRFAVPKNRLEAVFRLALDAARERTRRHLELPPGERFRVELVEEPPWSAYNWYEGAYESLIQLNVRFPLYPKGLLDLACHEGYPGHHVHHSLMEHRLLQQRGWAEHTVYALFSPLALTSEGVACVAGDLAFPHDERLELLCDELFPAAGLDAESAASYLDTVLLMDELRPATLEAARRQLDGELDPDQAARWLLHHSAMGPDRAARAVQFHQRYGAYIVTYFRGRELLQAHLDAAEDGDERWRRFREVVTSPRLLSDLPTEGAELF